MATVNQPNHGHQAVIVPPPPVQQRRPAQKAAPRIVPPLPPAPAVQTKSKKLKLYLILAAIMAAILILLILSLFAIAVFTTRYTVETRIEGGESFGTPHSKIVVNVKGRAKNLAVLITNPAGKAEALPISKEEMTSESQTVEYDLFNDSMEGTYKVAVMLLDSKLIVNRSEVQVSIGSVSIGKMEPLKSDDGSLIGVKITLDRDGNLPIGVSKANVFINERKCILPLVKNVYKNGTHLIEIGTPGGFEELKRGKKFLVKGELFYGEKSLPFEKELTL